MDSESSTSQSPEWFAGRTCVRRTFVDEGVEKTAFEERIVVVKARTFDEADKKIWAEARDYVDADTAAELLPTSAIYCVQEPALEEGVEVWSVVREEALDPLAIEEKYHSCEYSSFLVEHFEHVDTLAALKTRYSKGKGAALEVGCETSGRPAR